MLYQDRNQAQLLAGEEGQAIILPLFARFLENSIHLVSELQLCRRLPDLQIIDSSSA